MEMWMKDAQEYTDLMNSGEQLRECTLQVKRVEDLQVSNPSLIRSLYIGECEDFLTNDTIPLMLKFVNLESIVFSRFYSGLFSPEDLNVYLIELPKLRKLSIFGNSKNMLSWELVARLCLDNVESLTLHFDRYTDMVPLIAPNLEELVLYGPSHETTRHKRERFDFSGMPNLRKLDVRYWQQLDYSSFDVLSCLKELFISDQSLHEIDWLSENYSLSKLCVWGKIESISGLIKQPMLNVLDLTGNRVADLEVLRNQKSLRSLHLRSNRITDPTVLSTVTSLEYLDLCGNPLKTEGCLRSVGIKRIYLTEEDHKYDAIDSLVSKLTTDACWRVRREKEVDISKYPPFLQKKICENRNKTLEERLPPIIQDLFETSLKNINPFELGFRQYDYTFKDIFIEKAKEKFPFLEITPDMQKTINHEKERLIKNIPLIPGVVFFVGNDLVRIHTRAKKGSGKVRQTYDERYVKHTVFPAHLIKANVQSIWNKYFSQEKLEEYDIEIVYAPLYGKYVDAKISIAVLISIWSAINKVPIQYDTAIQLRLADNGRLGKIEASNVEVNAVKLLGMVNILSGGRRLEQKYKEGVCIKKYTRLDEAFHFMFVSEQKLRKYKELDKFQLSFLDVLDKHRDALNEPLILRNILRDYFPEYKKEVNLLDILLHANILKSIDQEKVIEMHLLSKYVSLLENNCILRRRTAAGAVTNGRRAV